MNPLSKALKIKTGAEQKLQGVGRAIGTAMRNNKAKIAASPASRRAQANFNKTGLYPD